MSRSLSIKPTKHFINIQQDPYSNYLARIVFPEPAKELVIDVSIIAQMVVINPFDFFVEEYAENYPFTYEKVLERELKPFLETEPPTPKLAALLETIPRQKKRTINFIVDINQLLQKEIQYLIRLEPGVQACEETLMLKSGSCRDSAWLMVQVLRNLGIAARFVSGYLIQLTQDIKSLDGPSGSATDFTDLHAWTEAYLPGAGWVGFDPTSGLLAGEGHIPLACTAEPSSAAPVSGAVDKCESEMHVSMTVTRIHEAPRVTKPYPEEIWTAIDALGIKVESDLKEQDVRLTMGGEPTFVGIDNTDNDEWNTAAVGPTKRFIAGNLIKRLRSRFAPGGLLHYGQGKWYPGESLPRWALGCYWRKDGEPIWNDPELIAKEDANEGFDAARASHFIRELAQRLDVDPACSIPGYEDVWQYMLAERRLPANVDPLDNRLDDPETRKRLSKVFDQGLEKIIGYALPLERRYFNDSTRWATGRWFFRREHLYLIPGDSPMGFRLPLDSHPWSPKDERAIYPLDPLAAAREALPPFANLRPGAQFIPGAHLHPGQRAVVANNPREWAAQRLFWPRNAGKPYSGAAPVPPLRSPIPDKKREPQQFDVIRTALCVEPRNGHLYIFMPPQRYLEDYLILAAAIEDTARELGTPVVIEGYTPPDDARLNAIKVTPDPGVIEVNIHPATSWQDLSKNTEILYAEAHQSRLQAVKYMIDGRQTGTGGGNHIVIGGGTPEDSPILRRPDVLKSLIAFWHNHPALSYLFSGMFIGPTSQHPRIDEARHDSLYELEIAFKNIPDGGNVPPWLVDRTLRNLLIDCTGNTHRTEFCIDKLYSPDTASGRLGLVEIRSFEMPPHERMSLAQQLLIRGMLSTFWKTPYKQKLARWGTELHDRFMLPHFVKQDFQDALLELNDRGLPFSMDWFLPHFEFRFPELGAFAQQGIHVELRAALEPWHVLGEENSPGGVARYVDSSVERLQVKVKGMTDTRHSVVCNGHALPLHPTGTNGEFVAGVRYRAWQPPSCLHPTIPIDSPLAFDLYDSWNKRMVGGCTYHVVHPGGLSYETLPINANSAEARRIGRFSIIRQRPGAMEVTEPERNPEFPFTLDLRKTMK